jgi:hypothetical protein
MWESDKSQFPRSGLIRTWAPQIVSIHSENDILAVYSAYFTVLPTLGSLRR